MLQAFGLKLDRFDFSAKRLLLAGFDQGPHTLEPAANFADRNDSEFAPGANRFVEFFYVFDRQLPPACGQPQQKQQQIDVDAVIILQRDASIRDAGLSIEMQRKSPQRGFAGCRRFAHVEEKQAYAVLIPRSDVSL